MADLPANDAAVVFCPSKTEGFMSWLPSNDARRACFFIASNGRFGARSHLINSLGRKPSRFFSSLVCCLRARKHRGEAQSSTSSPHEFPEGGLLRELRLALVSRLGSSMPWLRQPFFEAFRKITRKLLMRHLIVVLGLTLDVYRCSLARTTGNRPAK